MSMLYNEHVILSIKLSIILSVILSVILIDHDPLFALVSSSKLERVREMKKERFRQL